MCGRFAYISEHAEELREKFELRESRTALLDQESCYNIAPGFEAEVVVKTSPNHMEKMRWGLLPPWAKDIRIGYSMINARAETLRSKVSFMRPLRNKRCIIPISGFYEWKVTPEGKQPYYIYPGVSSYWGLAGLYEIHPGTENKPIKSFTIITVGPNKEMARIHDRMPAILEQRDYEDWLNNTSYNEKLLLSMLKPSTGKMKMHPVTKDVGNAKNQGEDLIKEV